MTNPKGNANRDGPGPGGNSIVLRGWGGGKPRVSDGPPAFEPLSLGWRTVLFYSYILLKKFLLLFYCGGQWNKELRIEEATGESLGGAAWAHWIVREKGALDCCRSWISLGELLLPTAPWLQVSWDPLEFKRCTPVGKEKGEGKGASVLLGGRVHHSHIFFYPISFFWYYLTLALASIHDLIQVLTVRSLSERRWGSGLVSEHWL